MRGRNRLLSLATSTLLLGGIAASSVVAAPKPTTGAPALPKSATDITSTARGQQLIAEATERYAAEGYTGHELRAVKDDTGTIIAPIGTKFGTYSVTLADGRHGTALAPLTPDAPAKSSGPASTGGIVPLTSPSWSYQDNACFSQISDTWSVLDHCYYMYRLSNDGNGSYDWFALNHFGTARNNSPWVLDQAKIRSYKAGGNAQTWADWSPKSDWSGGSCSTVTVGVATPVGGIGVSWDRCPDQVTFSKSANGTSPDYTQTWFGLGTRANREVNYEVAVRVVQGGWAQWFLPAEVHGSPY